MNLVVRDRNISHYEEVVAFDWKIDGSVGSFPVRKHERCDPNNRFG